MTHLFEAIKNVSIKVKLLLLTVGITAFAITIGFCIIIINDIHQFKMKEISRIRLIGQVVADYSIPDILFADTKEANKTLQKLTVLPDLQWVAIYDENDNLFVEYGTAAMPVPKRLSATTTHFKTNTLHTIMPITTKQNHRLGTIYIATSTRQLFHEIFQHFLLLFGALCGLMVLAFIIATQFQRIISVPILQLAQVTKHIADTKDYTYRLPKHEAHDEIGALYISFQHMMSEIHRQHHLLNKTAKELELAMRAANVANKAKTEFLAKMSHEFRTPLNSLLILTNTLIKNHEKNLLDDQIESLRIIYKSGQYLLNLINDILDISKIEARKVELNMRSQVLDEILLDCKHQFQPIANETGIDFIIEKASDLPNTVVTDRQKLVQILHNLLSNAFKFTKQGTVKLSAHKAFLYKDMSDKFNHTPAIIFCVIDTGLGIAETHLKTIFTAFEQADFNIQHKFGGTGLGLAIAKENAELLGGKIDVTSKLHEGSCFSVYIPSQSLLDQHATNGEIQKSLQFDLQISEKDIPKIKSQNFLVVDQDMRSAFALSQLLNHMNCHSVILPTIEKAYRQLENKNNTISGIFIDIRMAQCEDYALLKSLKAYRPAPGVPVFVINASDLSDEHEMDLRSFGVE